MSKTQELALLNEMWNTKDWKVFDKMLLERPEFTFNGKTWYIKPKEAK